jgi:hypothetical protein
MNPHSEQEQESYPHWNIVFQIVTMMANQILALHAYTLLDQVPISTRICYGFVAPHREAFQRTIAIMHYTNLRLMAHLDVVDKNLPIHSLRYYVYYPLLAISWWQFVPWKSNFSNGNTWIFVIPMFGGVTLECLQYLFLTEYCHGKASSLVHWKYLMGVHLSAMIMAFAFTLAFRGMVSIQFIYFGAAFLVALLFLTGLGLIVIGANPDADLCHVVGTRMNEFEG